ncbi:iron ABC transporter permease [Laribacter hongkongensis]|uniref:ABC transporter permease n=1 Tax=Laribacter hongkongensis TaxID=168471 RepID=UPI001EFEBCBF|nr:iron ABC transporter permease [Laribacter hongkongensis]MCG8992877.1 iron ABC transporter permease [Laribacter hongkongensis]MCG8999503.1 iron ABC transporter permease [Laribacter hongkongensis]MCG9002181.1 iron ABC transporter permease [Laribacter hongkongensis]MCG9005772.1 iron ABC transporter permease [Laribacter hongkongensis]MCG9008733.1 iron ABC transporter permease [Laribacter hongkongensis]
MPVIADPAIPLSTRASATGGALSFVVRTLNQSLWRWRLGSAGIALLTAIPLAVILSSLGQIDLSLWQHLGDIVLPTLLANTAILLTGVGIGVLLLGVPLAWLTAVHDFPGRRFFSWALMLPLAMPAYVLAFAMVGLLDFTGPLQTWLRTLADGPVAFPPIRSTGGVIIVMSLSLYPYVYLLARNAFATQGRRALEAAASLGLSPWQGFWRVALPMARPWIIGGLSLALMETLADFGTVSVFNFDTFTTAIYKAWFSFFSLPAAAQLASLLVIGVFGLVWLEQRARGRRAYVQRQPAPLPRTPLHGKRAWLATTGAGLVLLLAFGVPFAQLLVWALSVMETDLDARYFGFVGNTLLLALLTAGLVTTLALLLAYAQRRDASLPTRLAVRLATLGYAVPGTVLAVGVFVPVAWLDNQLLNHLPWLAGQTAIFKGTLAVMLLALAARFAAVGFSPVDSALARIPKSQEESARLLGMRGLPLLRRVYLPQLRGGLLTALLMVLVDTMKEMPITLMTRPFGWDTLAVRVFEMTSEGQWDRAALPSVAIVLTGLIPVLLLARETRS